jgi:hypothetical protein
VSVMTPGSPVRRCGASSASDDARRPGPADDPAQVDRAER